MPRPIRYKAPSRAVTEIRVHGVGGTPPEDLLEDPHPEQVSGDHTAGFFRRSDSPADRRSDSPADRRSDSPADRDVEAYSWGGLTSQNVIRSLWLLLLPFTLVNVAGWMVEIDIGKPKDGRQPHAEIEERLLRVVAALLTISVVAWASAIFVDLIAFQCGSDEECRQGHWWLEFLGSEFFAEHPLARVSLGAVIPMALLGLLAWLSRSNRKSYDEFPPFGEADTEAGAKADLMSAKFWYRPSLVGDLAALHGAAASFAMAALIALTFSSFYSGSEHDDYQRVAAIAGILSVVALLACAVLRWRRRAEEKTPRWVQLAYFTFGCIGVLTVAGLLARGVFFVRTVEQTPEQLTAFSRMPFYLLALEVGIVFVIGVVHFGWWIFHSSTSSGAGATPSPLAKLIAVGVAAAYLLILLGLPPVLVFLTVGGLAFIVVLALRRSWVLGITLAVGLAVALVPRLWEDTWTPAIVMSCLLAASWTVLAIDATWARDRFRWGGGTVPCLVGVFLVAGIFTGAAKRIADFLDKERSVEEVGRSEGILLQLPQAYDWFAIAFAAALLITAISAAVLYLQMRFRFRQESVALPSEPPPSDATPLSDTRAADVRKRIRSSIALVRTIGGADLLLMFLGAITALVLLRGIAEAMNIDLSLDFVRRVTTREFWARVLKSDDYPLPDQGWVLTTASWILAALPVAVVVGLRKAYSDRGARRKLGILWDVGTFWPRRFHPFAPPSYSERAVPELQERIKLATDGGRTVVLAAHSQGSVVAYAAVASSEVTGKGKIVLATYGSPLGSLYRRYFPNYFRLSQFNDVANSLEAANSADGRGWRNFHRLTDPIGGPAFAVVTHPLGDDIAPTVDPHDAELRDPWWAWHRKTQPLPPLLGHSDYLDDPVMQTWIG